MKKSILLYGVIAGIIIAISMQIQFSGVFDLTTYGEIIGYSSMIIAFSMIFVGVKKYKDSLDGQKVKFVNALSIGLGISLIGTLFYVISWGFIDGFTEGNFLDTYETSTIEALKKEDASDEEIAAAQAEINTFRELYKNPITKAGITAIEILPVGLFISFISAFIFWYRDKARTK